jgi:hypothetical protein
LYPIKLSYHGRQHYNSLIPIENFDQFKNILIKTPPGEYEKLILEKLKLNKMREPDRERDTSDMSSENAVNRSIQINNISANQICIDVPAKVICDNLEGDKAKLEMSRGNFMEKSK